MKPTICGPPKVDLPRDLINLRRLALVPLAHQPIVVLVGLRAVTACHAAHMPFTRLSVAYRLHRRIAAAGARLREVRGLAHWPRAFHSLRSSRYDSPRALPWAINLRITRSCRADCGIAPGSKDTLATRLRSLRRALAASLGGLERAGRYLRYEKCVAMACATSGEIVSVTSLSRSLPKAPKAPWHALGKALAVVCIHVAKITPRPLGVKYVVRIIAQGIRIATVLLT